MARTCINEIRAAYGLMESPFFASELQEKIPDIPVALIKNSLRVMRNNGEIESELVPFRNRMEYRYMPGTPKTIPRINGVQDIGKPEAALRLAAALGIHRIAA